MMLELSTKDTQNIQVEIIKATKLILQPGKQSAIFEVKVKNNSSVYASFQLDISFYDRVGNSQPKTTFEWYRISPEIGTLKPPGAWTTFTVEILQPPVPGFVGRLDLIISISSDEIVDKPRKILKDLIVEKGVLQSLVLDLPVNHFKEYTGNIIEIPVYIYNPNYVVHKNVQLKVKTIPNSENQPINLTWLDRTSKPEIPLDIRPDHREKIVFYCQIPNDFTIRSTSYHFIIEATDPYSETFPTVEGQIEILPQGSLNFEATPLEREIRPQPAWKFWRSDPVSYNLQPQNNSNISQEVNFEIQGEDQEKCELQFNDPIVKIEPQQNLDSVLTVNSPRPWVGLTKQLQLPVQTLWSDSNHLTNQNDTQNLKLILKPILPLWLQLLGGAFLLWLIWLFSPFNPANAKHKDAVNSVQFNGVGTSVISGSNDQTVISWNTDGFSNWRPLTRPKIKQFQTGNNGKAVRVVRYRPVDNNLIAVGLENGEIQIWDLLSKDAKPTQSFSYKKDDRVLSLEFSRNSRYLLSGHGSGLVLVWDLQNLAAEKFEPISKFTLNFTISSMGFLGKDDQNLVLAGRYNSLVIANVLTKRGTIISYPQKGTQNDYIETLDTTEGNPTLMVTGDTQGYITIWDLKNCLTGNTKECGEVLERWDTGHQKQPVRSVALSEDGCYLVSGGDDGRTMLWPLTKLGKLANDFRDGKVIDQGSPSQGFYGVDLKKVKNKLLIASGNEDTRVRVRWEKTYPEIGCE